MSKVNSPISLTELIVGRLPEGYTKDPESVIYQTVDAIAKGVEEYLEKRGK